MVICCKSMNMLCKCSVKYRKRFRRAFGRRRRRPTQTTIKTVPEKETIKTVPEKNHQNSTRNKAIKTVLATKTHQNSTSKKNPIPMGIPQIKSNGKSHGNLLGKSHERSSHDNCALGIPRKIPFPEKSGSPSPHKHQYTYTQASGTCICARKNTHSFSVFSLCRSLQNYYIEPAGQAIGVRGALGCVFL